MKFEYQIFRKLIGRLAEAACAELSRRRRYIDITTDFSFNHDKQERNCTVGPSEVVEMLTQRVAQQSLRRREFNGRY